MEGKHQELLNVSETNNTMAKPKYRCNLRRKNTIFIIVFVLSVVVAIVIGVAVGSATVASSIQKKRMEKLVNMVMAKTMRLKTHEDIVENLDASNLRENLRYFSLKPHSAGTPRNNELGDEIHRRFKSYGFESKKESYSVLLSFPRKDKPNYGHIIDETGKAVFTTQKIESVLEPSENTSEAFQPFNAYSPAATVTGDLVYVNYGRYEDFQELKEKYNVSCKGKIVIVKYGKIFRGDKVKNAESNGAIGILIYSDPSDYGPVPDNQVFPNGWWLSRDGVQRGSISPGKGDMLTPGYPSTDGAYRVKDDQLPTIPSHPISAQDAFNFLSKMAGQDVKTKDWEGKLQITYKVGPGFSGKFAKWKVKIQVHNEKKQVKITNIIGTLKGSVEPDRYVLMGNHRDSWGFGGVDACSGTTTMMEIARAISEKVKTGWRPRRTLIFCSWDGEEHGIIGSSEWVEHHIKILRDRAVAYFNMDSTVTGNYTITPAASPLLYKAIMQASSQTKDPFQAMTVLQKHAMAVPSKTRPGRPLIFNLGSGSDFIKFYQLVGIPSLDYTYAPKTKTGANRWFYPVYHSLHDTFYWVTKFVDPEFKIHLAVARVATRSFLDVADSPVLPWNVTDYAIELKSGVEKLKQVLDKNDAAKFGVKTDYLEAVVEKFEKSAAAFHRQIFSKDMTNPLILRMINDRLMHLEKGFILPEGLPGRPYTKHLVYAPSLYNAYGSTLFSGVVDQLYGIEKNPDKWETVKIQLTILASRIESVAETLVDDM